MKDIPIFTGQYGCASLILREIPYKKQAYVLVRSVLEGKMRLFLEECREFCIAAGAETVSASADEPLPFLPHIHDMLELTVRKAELPPLDKRVALLPVTRQNASEYQEIYNLLFRDIPNAATCTGSDLERLIQTGSARLAAVDGQIAGIGETDSSELRAIGVLPQYRGLGAPLALTLIENISVDPITLRVSSSNTRALRLYEKLNFHVSGCLSRWYALVSSKEG